MYPAWSENKLQDSDELIHRLEHEALKLFRKYQHSGFNTTKWNMLDGAISDIKWIELVRYIMTDFYESSQNLLKKCYMETSKRSFSAMGRLYIAKKGNITIQAGRAYLSKQKAVVLWDCKIIQTLWKLLNRESFHQMEQCWSTVPLEQVLTNHTLQKPGSQL